MKKLSLVAIMVATTAALSGVSSAVTLSLTGLSTSATGLITLSGNTVSGRAIFVSTTADISASTFNLLSPLLTGETSSAEFDAALASAIGTTTGGSPGIIRTATFTNGALTSTGTAEFGDVGNKTYMFLVAESAGNVSGFGSYTGANAPSLGAVTFNPGTAGDSIGIGTSVSGFQLAPVVGIPEPSAALLGAIGALGLLRRRRI